MQWLSYVSVCALLAVGLARAGSAVRGVAPQDAHLYQPHEGANGPMWKCLHSDKVIPFSRVNDDYCDCEDGSDEPGTAACPNGRFYCANKGFIPAFIPTSRVNDGVCDAECCDGSDETDGKVSCLNTCKQRAQEYQREQAKAAKVHAAGARKRAKYIEKGMQGREQKQKRLDQLHAEVTAAREEVARTKRTLDARELGEERLAEVKKQSALYKALEQRQSALRHFYERSDELFGNLRVIANLMDKMVSAADDAARQESVDAFKDWRAQGADEGVDREQALLSDRLDALERELSWEAGSISDLIEEDVLEVMDGAPILNVDHKPEDEENQAQPLYHIPSYLPDSLVPYYESLTNTLVDLLIKLHIVSPAQRYHVYTRSPTNVKAAREAHEAATSRLEELKAEIDVTERELGVQPDRYGFDGEFRALEGECVRKVVGDYTYEFCFLDSTRQISNNDGYTFNLGRFHAFDYHMQYDKNDYRRFTNMLYRDGQICWNGPPRSTEVQLECGEENELLHVFEAEKCVYSMRVSTPAVCFPKADKPAEENALPVHEEL